MSNLPTLDESAIENRVGRRSFRRGRDYFRNGAISHARRQGSVLKATCAGSSLLGYRVQVTLGEQGIADANCSCPVGTGGSCKHVAALLIGWREAPEVFVEAEELHTSLERCTRGELMNIVKQIVFRRPELELAVEEMLPRPRVAPARPSPESYRRRVAGLLRRAGTATDAGDELIAELIAELRKCKRLGDHFAERREFGTGAVVYQAIIAELLPYLEEAGGRPAGLDNLADECVEALGGCLQNIPGEPEERTAILKTLLDVYHFHLVCRQNCRNDLLELIVDQAHGKARQAVVARLLELVSATESRTSRRALGEFVLELEGGRLDDEAFCRLCRQTGRTLDLVRRLVRLGRTDQAVEEARGADTYELFKVADLLVRHHQAEIAERLVQDRWEATRQEPLERWLQQYRQARRDQQTALELSEKLFRLQPDRPSYRRLRALGRQLGDWDRLQPELLSFLEHSGRTRLLVRIHLDEHDVDRALEVVIASGAAADGSPLAIEVARAAERSRPRDALAIYLPHVDHLIAAGSRAKYAQACRYLQKVRALMKQTGGEQNWTDYITALRNHHRALKPLLEELDAAGL